MKKRASVLFFIFYFLLLTSFAFAQINKGKITDSLTGLPVAGATVSIDGIGTTSTNESGVFEFKKIKTGSYHTKISSIGFKTIDSIIN
ncbi:MAG TPA: carboxypeptidase regulatory-like domain-containing protein, partial [Puia sp.]|nr:carboxypeptidase regulatory-like domain-containing protein [Puia sp.]